MEGNFWILLLAGLIPMVVGAIWYSPSVLGKMWMKASGVTEEQTKTGNMIVIFGLSYVFSVFIAMTVMTLTIHQMGAAQILMEQPVFKEGTGQAFQDFTEFMSKYGTEHRTWTHGLLHGGFAAVTMALPLIGILGLFERRGWRYILVHFGYWFVTLVLMGGVIAAYF